MFTVIFLIGCSTRRKMFMIQSAPQLANCLMTTKYTYEKKYIKYNRIFKRIKKALIFYPIRKFSQTHL